MFKHSQILTKTLITTSLLTFSLSSHAALTFGNAEEGELKVSGTVRAKYIYDFDSDPLPVNFLSVRQISQNPYPIRILLS